jgi:flagellar basal-body rod modification protein FlgD
MPVQGVSSGGYGPVMGAPDNATEDLNKIDFMNLLIAQIKHQDPMSPMDNQQFISQLTQFASLEEMQGMNSRFDDSMILTQSLNNTMMLGLVGKTVSVSGDVVTVSDGEVSSNRLQAATAGVARIEVRDIANNVVATYTVPVTSGMNDITWNGKTTEGDDAADGPYRLHITVEDSQGASQPFMAFMSGTVESIRYENNYAIVRVGGEEYYVSEIESVSL